MTTGETIQKGDDFVLETEIEFQLRCLLHGTKDIRFQPRPLNLGHGRVTIDKGAAVCLGTGCNGSGIWLTIDLYVVNTEKIPKEKWDAAMRAVLVAEMGAAKQDAVEEEVSEPEPQPAIIQSPVQTRAVSGPTFGDRPPL